jgi:membrane-associated phospholipid phosphatase
MRGWAIVVAMALSLAQTLGLNGCKQQSAANIAALKGLAPLSALANSPAGKNALAANFSVTGAIQNGTSQQPALLPFPAQQEQALKDAFITGANASQLADGLGTKLGSVYQSRATYTSAKDYTSISPAVAKLFGYTGETTGAHSKAAKYFLGNETSDGTAAVPADVAAILTRVHGAPDVFGRAYGRPAGSAGADAYGDSRPFQTEPGLTPISGTDYFGHASNNMNYLRGPAQNLVNNPSFPSGHTTYGYGESLLLAIMVPERYPQQIVRAAEYGNDRIILGAHYAMDVIGGRALALYDVAHLLANDPNYVGQPRIGSSVITDYQQAVTAARADLVAVLESGCGAKIAVCATQDTGRFSDSAADQKFYDSTQTYGLPVVYQTTSNAVEDVARLAPEAGYLLTAAFPYLSLQEADGILTETEGPGGGFLDDGSAFGLYSRLNLFAASRRAIEMAPAKH